MAYRGSVYTAHSYRSSTPAGSLPVNSAALTYRAAPYRAATYRGRAELAETDTDVAGTITYPYPALSGNDFSYGAVVITDTDPPFTPGGISLLITNQNYRFNRQVNSTDVIPMCWDSSVLAFVHSGTDLVFTVTEEPLLVNAATEYYTPGSVSHSSNYTSLISIAEDYPYFLNLIFLGRQYSNTGNLLNYAVEALLIYLAANMNYVTHVCLTKGITTNLLEDHATYRPIFYTSLSGNEVKGVWRSLPEKDMIKNIYSSMPGKSREDLIEFLIKELYTHLENKWNELTYRG